MEEDIFSLIWTIIVGLCLGSLATALSYRLPRNIEVMGFVRSACPSCRKKLSLFELVPVLSWVFLRGKCRSCKSFIGWNYPAIEIATLLLCLVFYYRFGFSLQTVLLFALAPVAVSAVDIDLKHKILPDSLNLAILVIGIILLTLKSTLVAQGSWISAFLGLFLYAGGAFILRQGIWAVLKREPMGLGDVKFFAAAGFWLGTNLDVLAGFLFLAGFLGVALALVWQRLRGEKEFPFGPVLILSFLIMLIKQGPLLIFM